jgi:hypothetical protein
MLILLRPLFSILNKYRPRFSFYFTFKVGKQKQVKINWKSLLDILRGTAISHVHLIIKINYKRI